ncbi:MAG: hypothetical protein AAGF19_11330, partial [Pseudomonadota bacterium]
QILSIIAAYAPFPLLATLYSLQFIDEPEDEGRLPLIGIAAALALVAGVIANAWRVGRFAPHVAAGLALFALCLAGVATGGMVLSQGLWEAALFGFSLLFIAFGWQEKDRLLINLGFVFFGLEVFTIYISRVSSLMSGAGLFAVSGVVLVLLGLGIDRARRRFVPTQGPA